MTQDQKPKPMTKTERTRSALFADALRMIEFDVLNHVARKKVIPEDWHEIARNPTGRKTRVTIRVDEDVVKYFRAMGPGYQPRINAVLVAWVHGRLARMVGGPDVTDIVAQGDRLGINDRDRPVWGEMADTWDEQRAEISKLALDSELEKISSDLKEIEELAARKAKLDG